MTTVYHVYKLQFQTQFHSYITAHEINYRSSSMHTVAAVCTQQQQLTILYTSNVNIACACIHSRVLVLCMNCLIMSNSFYMNSFCGPLKLNLPRALKILRPAANSCICRMTQLSPILVCCSFSSNSYSYIATASQQTRINTSITHWKVTVCIQLCACLNIQWELCTYLSISQANENLFLQVLISKVNLIFLIQPF